MFKKHLIGVDVISHNMWKVKTRVKIATIIVVLKISFLLLICDFGHSYENCAKNVLRTATTYPLAITYETELKDLCEDLTWATGPRFLICVILSYISLDIIIYVCLFYVEDKHPPRRHQVRFADGSLAFDKDQRPVMNL